MEETIFFELRAEPRNKFLENTDYKIVGDKTDCLRGPGESAKKRFKRHVRADLENHDSAR